MSYEAAAHWPEYESHKIVRAAKVIGLTEGFGEMSGKVLLVDPLGDGMSTEAFQATEPGMTARAEVGWWAMYYPDGFRSVSPARQFEDGYTRRVTAASLGAAVRRAGLTGP